MVSTVGPVGQVDDARQSAQVRAENTELATNVVDRLLGLVGEFLRADAAELGLDPSMLAILDVLGVVSPVSVATLAGRCSLSHAATARAVGRLVEQGYAERVTDSGDGRSTWWVGRTARGDELLATGRARLRADLERLAAGLAPADRLGVLRVLPSIEAVVVRHTHARQESRWHETQYRRWRERQRDTP